MKSGYVMKVFVFEDNAYVNLLPITYTRASFEVRVGSRTFLENIVEKLRPEETIVSARKYLEPVIKERYPYVSLDRELLEDVLIVNGLLYIGGKELELIKNLLTEGVDKALIKDGRLVVAKLSERNLRKIRQELFQDIELLKRYMKAEFVEDARLITYPWELINYFPEILREELSKYENEHSAIPSGVYVRGDEKNIYVEDGSVIEPGSIIDVRNGPVYIGRNVEVESPSRIIGPSYIGDSSMVFAARIETSIIGEECRIGGEVAYSVIHKYSNKRHFGFLGHSYVGEWVNLGAGFTNSNLKNTYGEIRMNIGGRNINTGRTFLGCIIGDHVRASIGALVYTAKRIGVGSQIHGVIFEDIPSFTFYAKSLGLELIELDIEKVLKSVERMMARRRISLRPVEEKLLRRIYEDTAAERSLAGAKKKEIDFK